MTDTHTPDDTTDSTDHEPDYVFENLLEFLNHVDTQTQLRIMIEPESPLRGQDSHDCHLFSKTHSEDTDEITYRFATTELREAFDENYERLDVHYRFTVSAGEELDKRNIEVERTTEPEYTREPEWRFVGHLVGGGVMQTFN